MTYKIDPALLSTLFVHEIGDSITNSKVDSLNAFLLQLAYKKDIQYIDFNKFLKE